MHERHDRIGLGRFDFGDYMAAKKSARNATVEHDRRPHHQTPKTCRATSQSAPLKPIEPPPPCVLAFGGQLKAEFPRGEVLTLDRIAAALELNRATVQNYVATLARHGLLIHAIEHLRRGSGKRPRQAVGSTPGPLTATERDVRDYQRSRWATPCGARLNQSGRVE